MRNRFFEMQKHISFLFFCLTALLIAGCKSHKHTASVMPSQPKDKIAVTLEELEQEIDSPLVMALIKEAYSWIGTPYRYGGHSKQGTDCSGFVMEVYKNVADISLPHNSAQQQKICQKLDKTKVVVGDLVFFNTGKSSKEDISHVGIYLGNNDMIHASTSKGVIISNLSQKYYVDTYHSSGRIGEFDQKRGKTAKTQKKNNKTTVSEEIVINESEINESAQTVAIETVETLETPIKSVKRDAPKSTENKPNKKSQRRKHIKATAVEEPASTPTATIPANTVSAPAIKAPSNTYEANTLPETTQPETTTFVVSSSTEPNALKHQPSHKEPPPSLEEPEVLLPDFFD